MSQHHGEWEQHTSVEVTSIHALFKVKDTLIILHQAAQLFSKLQGHVLQGRGLCAVHDYSLCRLVKGCLSERPNKTKFTLKLITSFIHTDTQKERTISSSLMIILLMILWTVGISNWNISERVSMLQNKYLCVNLVKQKHWRLSTSQSFLCSPNGIIHTAVCEQVSPQWLLLNLPISIKI